MESAKVLDEKLAKIQAEVKTWPEGKRTTPDMVMLKQKLTPTELMGLWERLRRARGKKGMNIQEAWTTICKMSVGNTEQKRNVLWTFITGVPDEWQSRMVTIAEEVSKSEKLEKSAIPMSKGELIQALGADEALANIEKGKYDIVLDSDDEELYVKKRKTFTETVEKKSTSISTRRFKHIF